MNTTKRSILLKLSGEIFTYYQPKMIPVIDHIASQIAILNSKATIGIVVGGGNIFRGSEHGMNLGLPAADGHEIGMLATLINGRVLQAKLQTKQVSSTLLSALHCPSIAHTIAQEKIHQCIRTNTCMIFVGGIGSPYFTTDTTAMIRALQIGTREIWKITKVDGVYSDDPLQNKNAVRYQDISYQKALDAQLNIVDSTALTLGKRQDLRLRVFSYKEKNSLLTAFEDPTYGSSIKNS